MGELGALLRAKEAELAHLHSQLAASPDGATDSPLAALDGTGEVTAVAELRVARGALWLAEWFLLALASSSGSELPLW